MLVPAVKITFTVLLSGPFFVEVHLHGAGSALMEDFDAFFLVDRSEKCTKDTTKAVLVCQKSEQPPILENFETNNDQNDLKLYKYHHISGKITSVKGKLSILFTSSLRLVNVYRYQIALQPLIDAMQFCLDFVEFQILADHTQDVRNQNQDYQYISLDL